MSPVTNLDADDFVLSGHADPVGPKAAAAWDASRSTKQDLG
jgi:hypothetical protein